MPKAQRRDPHKERYWRRLLRLWRRSGLTGRDFCAQHGLSEPSFYAWRRELARRDQEATPAVPQPTTAQVHRARSRPRTATRDAAAPVPAFLKVTLPAATPAPCLELVLAQGRLLRVTPGFDADLLRQLLRVLEEPTC